MAKTDLNERVDEFFKRYRSNEITRDIVKSNLPINSNNEYGNILHAIINYNYPKEAIKTTIKILLELGVNPNYRGQETGMTFIHLALYGYTDANGDDHSYEENFICDLIELAKYHGFDVNIKDGDKESVAVAAIASEIYRGSIVKIISALGSEFIIDESLEKYFEKYLKESKYDPSWNKRLLREKNQIYKIINTSNLNLEDIEKEIDIQTRKLKELANDLTYEILKSNYKAISSVIKELNNLLKKREAFEVSDEKAPTIIKSSKSSITNVLTSEVNTIRVNPCTNAIETIKPIIEEFLLNELLKEIKEIESAFKEYQENLRVSARSVKTIREGRSFLENIKGIENEDELSNIVNAIIESLNEVIELLKEDLRKDKEVFQIISPFTNREYQEEIIDYENTTKEELASKDKIIKGRTLSYREYIFKYLDSKFVEIVNGMMPLIESGIINYEDITKRLAKSLKKENQGAKNNYGRKRI